MPNIPISRQDLIDEARRLLASLGEGTMSETAYDTAWVARVPDTKKPGEPLFPAAYDWLLKHQHADGSWGAALPFAHDRLICTLAALVTLTASSYRRAESEPAARRAVVYLNRERPDLRSDPHETVGFELLLPELVRQAQILGLRLPYEDWKYVDALKADKLQRIPPIALYGGPTTLTFSIEYLGDMLIPMLVERSRGPNGSYGASPSATAYVHTRAPTDSTESYLRMAIGLGDGGAMDVYPINVFETAWALQSLLCIRDETRTEYDEAMRKLRYYWKPEGVSHTDTGMVPDSDDTAVSVSVLQSASESVGTSVFELFEGQDYFYCYPFERNSSVSANASILEALNLYESTQDRRRMKLKIAHYLRSNRIDGKYWQDKWHTSPFYATDRVLHGMTGVDDEVVRTAVEWMLAEQHENGSWGVTDGTAEETAYALDALLTAQKSDPGVAAITGDSVQRGSTYLWEAFGLEDLPSLWVGKALYTPHKVVRAAIIGALAHCLDDPSA
jgi:halimadienyl-diphosphate synthase